MPNNFTFQKNFYVDLRCICSTLYQKKIDILYT